MGWGGCSVARTLVGSGARLSSERAARKVALGAERGRGALLGAVVLRRCTILLAVSATGSGVRGRADVWRGRRGLSAGWAAAGLGCELLGARRRGLRSG